MSKYEQYKALRDTGLTFKEIASRSGVTRQAVQQSLSRQRKQHWKTTHPHYAKHTYHQKIQKYFNNCDLCQEENNAI